MRHLGYEDQTIGGLRCCVPGEIGLDGPALLDDPDFFKRETPVLPIVTIKCHQPLPVTGRRICLGDGVYKASVM